MSVARQRTLEVLGLPVTLGLHVTDDLVVENRLSP